MRILKGYARDKLAFSPDGRSLLGGHGVWDLATGASREVAGGRWPSGFTPDGAAFFGLALPTGGRGDLEPAVFPIEGPISWQAGPAGAVGRTWNSRVIMSAAAGRLGHLTWSDLRWWTWPGLEPLPAWEGMSAYPRGAFTPDGKAVAVPQSHALTLFDVTTRGVVWRADGPHWVDDYAGPRVSPDGRWIAAASGTRLWAYNARTGEVAARLSLPRKYYQDIAFTADSRFLAGVSNEKTVKVYDTASWKLCHELAWEIGQLKSVAFSPDGMLGAASGDKKKIVVWDIDW